MRKRYYKANSLPRISTQGQIGMATGSGDESGRSHAMKPLGTLPEGCTIPIEPRELEEQPEFHVAATNTTPSP